MADRRIEGIKVGVKGSGDRQWERERESLAGRELVG